ncbi:MAG TPA: DUF6036 family nucleotidyltransferase [Bdellovibrionota bacterium]|nr:DUF6036 family nucleotidyltransferase [Bdellovibrionota bacterium]
MIKNIEALRRLLGLLDMSIHEPLEVFLIGAANLIARELLSRETMDIDVIVPPEFPRHVQEAVARIAVKEKIPPKWINTMPSRDARFLAPGWKERSSLFYEGEYLRAFLIGRKDMVGLKIAAAFDRQRSDAEDLIAMNPTGEEWAFGQEWARNYDANPDWPRLIDELVAKLKERQRG